MDFSFEESYQRVDGEYNPDTDLWNIRVLEIDGDYDDGWKDVSYVVWENDVKLANKDEAIGYAKMAVFFYQNQ